MSEIERHDKAHINWEVEDLAVFYKTDDIKDNVFVLKLISTNSKGKQRLLPLVLNEEDIKVIVECYLKYKEKVEPKIKEVD